MSNDVKSARRLVARFLRHATTIDELVDAVSAHRGRPIYLFTDLQPTDDHPTGRWEGFDRFDIIRTPADASPIQREQAVCHELAHMLLGHGEQAELTTTTVNTLFAPNISAEIVERYLQLREPHHTQHRTKYDEEIERDAEILGTMMAGALVAGRVTESTMSVWDQRS